MPRDPSSSSSPTDAIGRGQPQLQSLLISATDHEVLSRSIECCRRLFAGARSPNADLEFKALKWMLQEKLPDHFTHEDTQVFPALRAANPQFAQQIEALQCEHCALLEQAHRLTPLLARRSLNTCTGELWMWLLDFFESLEIHSRHEEALMAQVLEATPAQPGVPLAIPPG